MPRCLKPATKHIIRSLKTRLLLSNSFSFTVFHSNWQYFTHSNSQQLTVIHCDEPNTGFEPRLIAAYFFARWSGWRLQKNDSPDLPFYFTLSFFYCFKNANSLPGKRSTAGCFYLIKPKKARIFGIFPKRKHCTIVSFVQCSYGCGSQI